MASKKEINEAIKTLGPLATVLQKSAGELWKIFVWRYRAIGLAMVTSAFLLIAGTVWLWGAHSPALAPVGIVSIGLVGFAMYFLISPHYLAMNDVVVRVRQLSKPQAAEVQLSPGNRMYPF